MVGIGNTWSAGVGHAVFWGVSLNRAGHLTWSLKEGPPGWIPPPQHRRDCTPGFRAGLNGLLLRAFAAYFTGF